MDRDETPALARDLHSCFEDARPCGALARQLVSTDITADTNERSQPF